jgi:hypothetical protein
MKNCSFVVGEKLARIQGAYLESWSQGCDSGSAWLAVAASRRRTGRCVPDRILGGGNQPLAVENTVAVDSAVVVAAAAAAASAAADAVVVVVVVDFASHIADRQEHRSDRPCTRPFRPRCRGWRLLVRQADIDQCNR